MDFLSTEARLLLGLLGLLLGTGALLLGAYILYWLLTLPIRRAERARIFLDILELGMRDGRSPEASIIAVASSRDAALSARFYRVAGYIEQGRSFGQALLEVPRFLPPSVTAFLLAGERSRNLSKVLPAARVLLVDAISQVRGALNYVLLITLAITPAVVLLPILLRTRVLPLYEDLFEGSATPALTRLIFNLSGPLVFCLATLLLVLWGLAFAYIAGPRLRSGLSRLNPWAVDRFLFLLPWRRKRLLRNFSLMLGMSLDAGMPEAEAVRLAGEACDNRVIRHRAESISQELAVGKSLPEAIANIDSSGQLRWRLCNALRSDAGFSRALAGWHELLDAKAYQQEQAAAQLLTTGMVLVNGTIIGFIAAAMFLGLINLINQAALW